jgi:hypothetical protein
MQTITVTVNVTVAVTVTVTVAVTWVREGLLLFNKKDTAAAFHGPHRPLAYLS